MICFLRYCFIFPDSTACFIAHCGSFRCKQERNLQAFLCFFISIKQLSSSSCSNSVNSNELKPGVSATNPLFTSINSTCLVVCLPRPKLFEISPVSIFKLGLNLFNNEDFPTPDWPIKTVTSPFSCSLTDCNGDACPFKATKYISYPKDL